MRLWIPPVCVVLLAAAAPAPARKLTFEERIEITRGLTAEYATVKVLLPRSKKALPINQDGTYDKQKWEEAGREHGPAARAGDLIQITKVDIGDDKLTLDINGGFKGGRKWYERIEVGMGSRTSPIGSQTTAPGGTSIVILFPKGLPAMEAAEFKKILKPVLDFERRSATEQFVETLPEPIQAAIKEQRAVEGMDREMVLLALGRPKNKVRESKEGVETEDWIFGEPPGKITFVTFEGSKVVRVKESYAGLGGAVMPPLEPR